MPAVQNSLDARLPKVFVDRGAIECRYRAEALRLWPEGLPADVEEGISRMVAAAFDHQVWIASLMSAADSLERLAEQLDEQHFWPRFKRFISGA